MQDNLQEAIEKTKQGDQQAATKLYSLTERMVYFTALKIVGDVDTAQDIVQDTYIKVYSGLSTLRDDRAFIQWVKSIVVNLCKNYMKKCRPILFESEEDEIRTLENIPEIREDFLPEEYANRREKSRLVMKIVDELPEAQRMTVILFYYDNLPISEVARIMEVSEGTVKSRLNYARKHIRDEIEQMEKDGTKLYAIPVLLLSRILQNAALDFSLPQRISETILMNALRSSPDYSGVSKETLPECPETGTQGNAMDNVSSGNTMDSSLTGMAGDSAYGSGLTSRSATGRIGGFTAINSGEITDCYSISKLKIKGAISGGFSGENLGNISSSFYSGSVQGIRGGVSGIGNGDVQSAYCFHAEPDKKLDSLRDKDLVKHIDAVNTKEAAQSLGFDTSKIWEPFDGAQTMRFIPKQWIHNISYETKTILIKTADELIELSRKINDGARELATATIRLAQDIDLGGKEWVPIGIELSNAFKGVFDGCGHTIRNFVIKSKEIKAKGFFGYLKGEVYNLTVDCIIKDRHGGVAGGIAAYCEEGVIGCCAAIATLKCGRGGRYGGLVGVNTGKIFQSYTAGSVSTIGMLWPLTALLLILLPLSLVMSLLMMLPVGKEQDTPEHLSVFAPIPKDISIQPIPDAAELPKSEGNFVSFQFENEIDIDLETGECLMNLVNPGTSNHDMVAQLQLTDAKAIEIMGSTGRTAEEQHKLNNNPQYDPENYRVTIAESGAVPPGYQLENLTLANQPNGATLSPGKYSAVVYLIFYDINTYNRAMLETQLPVYISVH